jgi:hypothetical protein
MAKKTAKTSAAGEEAVRNAGFVFKGTVQRLKASGMADLEPDDRTAVVRVDEVLRAPQVLAAYGGKEITVQLGGRRKIAAGDQAVFYANGWRFGEGIALRSVAERPVSEAPTAAVAMAAAAAPLVAPAAGASSPVQNHETQKLRNSIESADLIVSGRVESVRLAAETAPPAMAALAGAAPAPRRRISEHDPIWHEAVIQVTGVEKGTAAQQVVVRFPSSNDVRWHAYPKFQPGQEGVFLLNQEGGAAPVRALAGASAAAVAVGTPTQETLQAVTNPQPVSALGTIRALLGTSPSGPGEK